MSVAVGLELLLDTSSAAAGDILSGRTLGGVDEVQLVRRERTPGTRGSFHLRAVKPDQEGVFQLEVPADAPPSMATERCRIEYGLIARRLGGRRRRAAVAEEVEVTVGSVPVQVNDYPRDRLIASFDARGFHVELAQVELAGGGRLSGRVHTDQGRPARDVLVGARLLECWRIDRGWNVRHQPLWRDAPLWESPEVSTEWTDNGTWAGFDFRLPEGLPPAVEGRLMAWRYEVEARRPVRFAPDQRAVVTPIGFQAA